MSKDEKPISDQLKQAVDDLDLENKVKDAAAAAEQALLRGLDATGSYLRDHRSDIEGFLDRAGAAIDRQTSGRYTDHVEQVRSQLIGGVASLADRQWNAPVPAEPVELPPATDAPDVPPEDRPSPDDGGWAGSTDQV